jgi:hypothetical protein
MIPCVCSCNASRRTQGGIDRLMTFVLDELRERELSATGRFSRVVAMHFAVQLDDAHSDRVIAPKELMCHSRLGTTLVYLRREDRAKDIEAVRDLSWDSVFPSLRREGRPYGIRTPPPIRRRERYGGSRSHGSLMSSPRRIAILLVRSRTPMRASSRPIAACSATERKERQTSSGTPGCHS